MITDELTWQDVEQIILAESNILAEGATIEKFPPARHYVNTIVKFLTDGL